MGIRILIADDHEVVRQGIRMILKSRPEWEVCGEAVNGKDAIEKNNQLNPDLIIMDLTMPEMSGIDAAREIGREKKHPAVLIFTMHEAKHLAETVRNAGAQGLVLKSHAARDLVDALDALIHGDTFFGPREPGSSTPTNRSNSSESNSSGSNPNDFRSSALRVKLRFA